MEVEVHHIDAAIRGAQNPEQGVHIGPIPIDQSASLMNQVADQGDILIEHA